MKALAIVLLIIGILLLVKSFSPTQQQPQVVEKIVYVTPSPLSSSPSTLPPAATQPSVVNAVSPDRVEHNSICIPKEAGDKITIPACFSGMYDLGTKTITVDVTGNIDIGGVVATPQNGSSIVANDSTGKWGNLGTFGSLIYQIGEAGPFQVLVPGQTIVPGGQHIYVGINDSKYEDNRFAYHLRKR